MAKAKDGKSVPITLIFKPDLVNANAPNKLFLYGYGSYGISIDPVFRSELLSYVDRGVVYAIVHIRGGGDLGRGWYEDGKFLNKKNTFDDFIAAGDYLCSADKGKDGGLVGNNGTVYSGPWTTPNHMAICGRSAGGMLIGAVLNKRPDLCRVAIGKLILTQVGGEERAVANWHDKLAYPL
jgi:oligopeptidase B